MPDHSAGFRENKDLGKTRITDTIRVSSAAIQCSSHFGTYWQYETWIFSDDPRQRNRQVVHGTSSVPGEYGWEMKTKIIHQHITNNLMRKYGVDDVP